MVILGTVGYLGVEFLTFINPPKLELLYPEDNYVSSSNFIKILGKVEKASVLRLNDKEIAVGEDGFFQVDLDLNKGLNVIKFEAEKSTGKKTIEYERVIVE